MHNPFREQRRAMRDRRDRVKAEVRSEIEPIPDVVCTQCDSEKPMDYQRNNSLVHPQGPAIEAIWQCPDCEMMAFGYVGRDGLSPVLDNARPAEGEDED